MIEAVLVVYSAYAVRSEKENYTHILDGLNHIYIYIYIYIYVYIHTYDNITWKTK